MSVLFAFAVWPLPLNTSHCLSPRARVHALFYVCVRSRPNIKSISNRGRAPEALLLAVGHGRELEPKP